MSRSACLAIPVLVLAALASVAFAGDLDGKTFDITLAEAGGEPQSDTLIFADDLLDSVECRQYGFDETPYTAVRKGEGWTFSASATSEDEGDVHWEGTVRGETISGTMKWVKPGQDPIVYEFRGKLAP